jgi:PhzF family phenazine biosynthesis protein
VTLRLPFTQVDAFADRPFTGNPAAVMPLADWLDDATLQAIAEENNLAETAFTVKLPEGAGADYALRWFTPAIEVALCGHATLAAGHVLIGERDEVRFRTRQAGDLVVRRAKDGGYALDLPAWPMDPVSPDDNKAAGIARLIGGAPVALFVRPGGYRMFVYASADEVLALTPDFSALRALDPGDILYIATAPGTETDVLSRVFAPGAGIDEDPVTGSAHCLLAPYWAERLGRTHFSAVQASARGGYLGCEMAGERVILSGQCQTVIEGQFAL